MNTLKSCFSYGDIHAINEREQLYSVVAQLLGTGVFFGMLMGGVSSMLTNADELRGEFTHRFNVIRRYLVSVLHLHDNNKSIHVASSYCVDIYLQRELACSEDLFEQVSSHYQYLWLRWHGSTVENNFVDLPFSLQAEVAFQCYEKIFQKVGVYPTLYIYSMIV